MYDENLRNRSTLLFLNVLRNEHPRLHTQFMELFWQQLFVHKKPITSVSHYLRVTFYCCCLKVCFILVGTRIKSSVFIHIGYNSQN